jgi:hypothetical protein
MPYWIAVTTVGPVLALANTVTITSIGRTYLELAVAEQRAELALGREARPINPLGFSRTYNLAWLNFGIQACLTCAALWSLQTRQDAVPPKAATLAVLVSLLLVGWQTADASRKAILKWRAERLTRARSPGNLT